VGNGKIIEEVIGDGGEGDRGRGDFSFEAEEVQPISRTKKLNLSSAHISTAVFDISLPE
jgi:hypothetical protein